MSRKWKKIFESEDDFLNQKEGAEEYIYGKRKIGGKKPSFPVHLHYWPGGLRITTEWDKGKLSHKAKYDTVAVEAPLQKILESAEKVVPHEYCKGITPLMHVGEAYSGKVPPDTQIRFLEKPKLSPRDFMAQGFLVGMVENTGDMPSFVINMNQQLHLFTFGEALKWFPELENTWKNQHKIVKKMRGEQ